MIPKPLTGSALKNRQNRKRSFLIWQCYCSMSLLFNPKTLRPRPHLSVFLWKRISPPPPPSLTHRPDVSGDAVTENGFFQKRSPERRFLKTWAFRLRVDVRKRRFSNTMMSYIIYCKSSIKPPGGLNLFKHFWGGRRDLIEKGGLFKLFSKTHQREQGFSRTELWFPGVILLFLIIGKW